MLVPDHTLNNKQIEVIKVISRQIIGITTLFILVITACNIGAFAETCDNSNVYVNVHGSDVHGDGTLANPYATIQKGINEASVNGTVHLEPGTYKGKGNSILKVEKNLAVNGYSSEKTIQDGGNINEAFILTLSY